MRIIYFALLSLLLSACEWQVKPQHGRPAGLVCESPELARAYQQNISEVLAQIIELRIKNDYPDLLETKKIINAFDQSQVLLSSAQGERQTIDKKEYIACQAKLNININAPIFDGARTYSPFIYTPNSYLREINSVANANSINLNNNTLTQTIHYQIIPENPPSLSSADNQEITRMAQMLTTILLPYGVKNTVTLNGVVMDKNDALARILYTAAEEKNQGEIALKASKEDEKTISDEQKQKIDSQYQNAQNQLREVWQKLDDTVRQSLADEQQNWSESLPMRCEVNSHNNLPAKEAQTLCQVQQIEERINYLRGFMIE